MEMKNKVGHQVRCSYKKESFCQWDSKTLFLSIDPYLKGKQVGDTIQEIVCTLADELSSDKQTEMDP
jgi:hypothetical protein